MMYVLALNKTETSEIDSVILSRSDLSLMVSAAIDGFSKYVKLRRELDDDEL